MNKLIMTACVSLMMITVCEARWFKRYQPTQAITTVSEEDSADTYEIEQALLEQVNLERAKYNLPLLTLSRDILLSARSHCLWMSKFRRFQHAGPYAENIAMGQSDVKSVMQSWMGSNGHRANILNRNYTLIGLAAYRSSNGTMYWVQRFQ